MLSVIDPRFECSICLNCLKDPTLTRCGHRFCLECIHAWLYVLNLHSKILDVFLNNLFVL